MKNTIIEFENVTYEYEKLDNIIQEKALNNLNIEVNQGEFLVILGRNGSGKSTLAKHINALLLPSSGNVTVDGIDTKDLNRIWDIRSKTGMVFQNPDNQIIATIVEEDVAFGPENLGVPSEQIRIDVDEALKMVDMYEYRKHEPHLLSGGQKQRVAIAGTLAMKPNCIVFDESTAMLDPAGRKEVIKIIKKLNSENNITAILITHYMEEAIEADRIIVLEEGNVIKEGTPRQIFEDVNTMKEIGLDVPEVTELAHELNKNGINISKNILTVDELVDELCRLK
jgi:energy-coupling factor transport system ATP-binding protein